MSLNRQLCFNYVPLFLILLSLLYIVFKPHESFSLSPMTLETSDIESKPMEKTVGKVKAAAPAPAPTPPAPKTTEVTGHGGSSSYAKVDEKTEMNLPSCMNNAAFVSSNLLPKEPSKMESFAEFSPLNMKDTNFIDSSKFVIGTQSQSLRNANYQLRSDPPNPQKEVCPWMQSTIAPEDDRRPLEIGTGV
jgi:hypothetical protein